MNRQSLGTIEVTGLPAAIEAADVAVKAADVTLLGTELTDGAGMVSVKVLGEVSAVKAAMDAARVAAARVSRVVSVSIIARPDEQLDDMARSPDTVGFAADPAANATGDAASTLRMALYAGPPAQAEPAEAPAEPVAPVESVAPVEPVAPAAKPPARPRRPPTPRKNP